MGANREQFDAAVDDFLVTMEDADRPGSEPVWGAKRRFRGSRLLGHGWQVLHVRHPAGSEPEMAPLFLLETGEWVVPAWSDDVDTAVVVEENMAGIVSALAWLLEWHGLRASSRAPAPVVASDEGEADEPAVVAPEEPPVVSVSAADAWPDEWEEPAVPPVPDEARRSSAGLLICLAATYHAELHPEHLTDLVALANRAMAEAVPPYESVVAHRRDAGTWIVEDAVVSVAVLRAALVASPEHAEDLLRTTAICLVSTEERDRLAEIDRERPQVRGWQRYVEAGIEIAGCDVTALAAESDAVWSSATEPPAMSTSPSGSPSTPQTV